MDHRSTWGEKCNNEDWCKTIFVFGRVERDDQQEQIFSRKHVLSNKIRVLSNTSVYLSFASIYINPVILANLIKLAQLVLDWGSFLICVALCLVRPCVRQNFPNFSFLQVSEMFGCRSSEIFRKKPDINRNCTSISKISKQLLKV